MINWMEYVMRYYVENDYWTQEFVEAMVGKNLITIEQYEEAKLKKELKEGGD
ncbi:hypothetical protein [Terribacillus sp. 7520-G]|uniref:hypothetical protein n=1 Tax=Terribacillus sp. 7520-G TaxID=2025389 RepID=UPI0013047C29|nr:hypothetical protein [Terribacillus sp. 7520-G]